MMGKAFAFPCPPNTEVFPWHLRHVWSQHSSKDLGPRWKRLLSSMIYQTYIKIYIYKWWWLIAMFNNVNNSHRVILVNTSDGWPEWLSMMGSATNVVMRKSAIHNMGTPVMRGICSTPQVQGELKKSKCTEVTSKVYPLCGFHVLVGAPRLGLEERMLLCTLSLPYLKIQSAQLSKSGKWNKLFSFQPLKIPSKKNKHVQWKFFKKKNTSSLQFSFLCFLRAMLQICPPLAEPLPRAVHF